MNRYTIALFLHLLSLLLACAAASLATFAAVRLRGVDTVAEAMPWLAFTERVVVAFPVASLGLLSTGIHMTHQRRTWSVSWIDAALVGPGLIMALGKGVEGSRAGKLRRELESSGMTVAARRLLRDPLAWTAKMITLTLFASLVFLMTVKPGGGECVCAPVVAVAAGVLGAIPMWRGARPVSSWLIGQASS